MKTLPFNSRRSDIIMRKHDGEIVRIIGWWAAVIETNNEGRQKKRVIVPLNEISNSKRATGIFKNTANKVKKGSRVLLHSSGGWFDVTSFRYCALKNN